MHGGVATSIMAGQDDGFERALRARLLQRTAADLESMRSAVEAGDLGSIVEKAHRLAGAAGALRFDALSAAGCALEREAARGDAPAVRAGLEALDRALRQAFAASRP
jgi:HPt (histidine-containing phosphotransfer) domain-containing protein